MIGLRTSLSTDQSVEVSNLRSRPGRLAVRRKGSSQLSAVMSCPIRYVRQVGQRRRRRAETAVGVSMVGPRRRHAGLTAGGWSGGRGGSGMRCRIPHRNPCELLGPARGGRQVGAGLRPELATRLCRAGVNGLCAISLVANLL